MNNPDQVHAKLLDEQHILSRLAPLAASVELGPVVAGVLAGNRRLYVTLGNTPGDDSHREGAHEVPTGCLTQVFTATLIAAAAAEGRLGWDDPVAAHVRGSESLSAKLAGITVADLLRHSHGLDENMATIRMGELPGGLIDGPTLAEDLTALAPLHAPGEYYSYGVLPEYLGRAILESVVGAPYCEIIRNAFDSWRTLRCDAADSATFSTDRVFPVTCSVAGWLSFLQLHVEDPGSTALWAAIAGLRANPLPLPGWHPEERAACLGWKCYAGGWFGHNSQLKHEGAAVRFNPEQRIGIVVCGHPMYAALALSRMFDDVYPPFVPVPRQLDGTAAKEARAHDSAQYAGAYVRAEMSIEVTPSPDGELRLTGDRVPPCRLRPAGNHLFLADPFLGTPLPVVQFVGQQADGLFRHVWNGRQLWRRSTH